MGSIAVEIVIVSTYNGLYLVVPVVVRVVAVPQSHSPGLQRRHDALVPVEAAVELLRQFQPVRLHLTDDFLYRTDGYIHAYIHTCIT